MKKMIKFTLMSSVALGVYSSAAIGQTQSTEPQSANGVQLEDIVVTAQRRSERLQDVPLSVTALSGSQLSSAGIAGGDDLARAIPSLSFNRGTGTALIFLRGVGNSVASAGNEASTAVYIDGVYYARIQPFFLDFNNIDRVEVLKGPQGTLFGRNATGGLIQVITRTPDRDTHLEGGVSFGNYNTVESKLYASTGLGSGLSADFAVLYNNQGDGYGKNIVTGHDARKDKRLALRSKIVWNPTDKTNIVFSSDYSSSDGDSSLPNQPVKGSTQGAYPGTPDAIYPPLANFYDVRSGVDNHERVRAYGFSLRVEQDLDFANLVSISAYRHARINVDPDDVDYLPDNYFLAVLNERAVQKSQEFQLNSNGSDRFKWTVGLFYFDSEDGYDPGILSGRQFDPVALRVESNQRIKSYAAYAQGTYRLGDNTNLTGGLRYTKDNVHIFGTLDAYLGNVLLGPAAPTVDTTEKFSKATWKVALDHKLSSDVMVFASVSRGYKAGTFPTVPAGAVVAKPEVLDAYEIGIKSELFDRRVRINPSIFYYDIKSPQVDRLQGPGVQVVNAGSARVYGLDLDYEVRATEQFSIRGGVGLLNAKYKDFLDAPAAFPNPGPNGGNLATVGIDARGKRMPRAPKFTGNINAVYAIPIGESTLTLTGGLSYNGGFYWQPNNIIRQSSYMLIDGQIEYMLPGDHVSVRAWGKNLTNRQYYSQVYEQGGPFGRPSVPAAPRTYGVGLNMKF